MICRNDVLSIHCCILVADSIVQLEESLTVAKKAHEYAEKQEAVDRCVLSPAIDQKNKLEEEKDKQDEEIESLKAQLSDALKENEKLNGGIFGMTFKPSKEIILSGSLEYYNDVPAGLLTGRPEEEVSGF